MAAVEGSGSPIRFWQSQLPIDYIDTSLTINNFENVSANLSGGAPARLWYVVVEQTNNGATAEDLELEMTINGTAYTTTIAAAASGARQYIIHSANLTAGDHTFAALTSATPTGEPGYAADKAIPFVARTVGLIRVRQTTDVDGTSAQIEVNIVWDRLVGL